MPSRLVLLTLAAACIAGDAEPARSPTRIVASHSGEVLPADTVPKRVPPPDTLRGLYVNRWAAISSRVWELIDLAKETEVNALVIDVKDDRGLLLYRSDIPLVNEVGADTTQPMTLRRMRALMDTLRQNGIFPIARIVVAKDPLLADARREWAIHRRDDSTRVWLDSDDRPWLDPTHPEIWEYAADIAEEAAGLGFGEVQFDYVRFPDEDRVLSEGRYAKSNGRSRAEVIRDQLHALRERVRSIEGGVRMAIDVFGLTATDAGDMGIGQQWEMFADRADVVLPMNYPSHFAPGTYGLAKPNAMPYETMRHALTDAIARNARVDSAASIIPWLQDFTLGSPKYGAEQLRAQMQAAYDLGIPSWILWNPGSRYTEDALVADNDISHGPPEPGVSPPPPH